MGARGSTKWKKDEAGRKKKSGQNKGETGLGQGNFLGGNNLLYRGGKGGGGLKKTQMHGKKGTDLLG